MDVQLHRVSVVVLDAETVGPLGTPTYSKVEPKDPDRTKKILQLCRAIRTFQDLGLHVIVMTHRDIRNEIEQTYESEMNIQMGHFLCMKAYNPGFVDTITLAIEYEAFYVTAADLSNLQDDWRFPKKSKAFLRNNPELSVSFTCDNGQFQPIFAPGVVPGDFCIEIDEPFTFGSQPKSEMAGSNDAGDSGKGYQGTNGTNGTNIPDWPSGWSTDHTSPELAVLAVDCDGERRPVLAMYGAEKDKLLQSALSLCSGWNLGEVEYMKDWKYPVRSPWKELNGGGNLPHVVYVKRDGGEGLWAIGVSSRKKTRQRAAKLALFVLEKAMSPSWSGSLSLGMGPDVTDKIVNLVERTKQLILSAMSKSQSEVEENFLRADAAEIADGDVADAANGGGLYPPLIPLSVPPSDFSSPEKSDRNHEAEAAEVLAEVPAEAAEVPERVSSFLSEQKVSASSWLEEY